MARQNEQFGLLKQLDAACFIVPSWTYAFEPKQQWRQSLSRIDCHRLKTKIKLHLRSSMDFNQVSSTCEVSVAELSCWPGKRSGPNSIPRLVKNYSRSTKKLPRHAAYTTLKRTDHLVTSRDVTFDESTFAFSPTARQEIINDTALDFNSMDINDEPCIIQFKPTGKRNRSNSHN